MNIEKPVIEAKFVKRPNRFQGYVIIEGKEEMVHVPNTGRCKEILKEGTTVLLRKEDNPNRKTRYSLIGAYKGEKLINIDSQAPNKIVEEALNNQVIEELQQYTFIRREKTFGNSRFDFKLSRCNDKEIIVSPEEEYYLEVKGVTLEEDGETRFPDAPTERGAKHLMELIEVKRSGRGAGVIFVIQMENVKYFRPNDEMDKSFAEALRLAVNNGVQVFAYSCKVTKNSITLHERIPVMLSDAHLL